MIHDVIIFEESLGKISFEPKKLVLVREDTHIVRFWNETSSDITVTVGDLGSLPIPMPGGGDTGSKGELTILPTTTRGRRKYKVKKSLRADAPDETVVILSGGDPELIIE
jgi:hypothetical protein